MKPEFSISQCRRKSHIIQYCDIVIKLGWSTVEYHFKSFPRSDFKQFFKNRLNNLENYCNIQNYLQIKPLPSGLPFHNSQGSKRIGRMDPFLPLGLVHIFSIRSCFDLLR